MPSVNNLKRKLQRASINNFIEESQHAVFSHHHVSKLRNCTKQTGFSPSSAGEILEWARQRVAHYGSFEQIKQREADGTLPREDFAAVLLAKYCICKDPTRMRFHESTFEKVMAAAGRAVRKLPQTGAGKLYVWDGEVTGTSPGVQKPLDYVEEFDGYSVYYSLKHQNNQGGAQNDGYMTGVLGPIREVKKALDNDSPHYFAFVNDGTYFTDAKWSEMIEEAGDYEGIIITSIETVVEDTNAWTVVA